MLSVLPSLGPPRVSPGSRGSPLLDEPSLDPDGRGVSEQHLDGVDGVGMVLDEVGELVQRREQGLSDVAARDGVSKTLVAVVVTAHRAPVEGDVVAAAGVGDAVGLLERGAESLLRVDAAHAVLGGEDDRLGPRERRCGHADDIGPLLLDHLPVVEVGVVDAEAAGEVGHAVGAAVGDRDDLGLVDRLVCAEVRVGLVEAVREWGLVLHEAAHAARSYDRHPVARLGHRLSP